MSGNRGPVHYCMEHNYVATIDGFCHGQKCDYLFKQRVTCCGCRESAIPADGYTELVCLGTELIPDSSLIMVNHYLNDNFSFNRAYATVHSHQHWTVSRYKKTKEYANMKQMDMSIPKAFSNQHTRAQQSRSSDPDTRFVPTQQQQRSTPQLIPRWFPEYPLPMNTQDVT